MKAKKPAFRGNKSGLPQKTCIVCNRPFSWRKKWEKVWEEVKFCSEKCRSNKKNPFTISERVYLKITFDQLLCFRSFFCRSSFSSRFCFFLCTTCTCTTGFLCSRFLFTFSFTIDLIEINQLYHCSFCIITYSCT